MSISTIVTLVLTNTPSIYFILSTWKHGNYMEMTIQHFIHEKSILNITEDKLCERAKVLVFYRRRKSPAHLVEKQFSSDCTFLLAACSVFRKDTDYQVRSSLFGQWPGTDFYETSRRGCSFSGSLTASLQSYNALTSNYGFKYMDIKPYIWTYSAAA